MVLAALLLKLGGYGLYLVISMMEDIAGLLTPVYTWALVGGCISGLVCLTQTDLKSLIAYTSISHIALVVGALSRGSLSGGIAIIISHGFTSSALFVYAYMAYKFSGSRSTLLRKGLFRLRVPLALLLFLLAILNLGVPPRLNFIGEVFAGVRILEWALVSGVVVWILVFLRGVYRLVMFSGLCHGQASFLTLPGPIFNSRQIRVIVLHLAPSFLLITKLSLFT